MKAFRAIFRRRDNSAPLHELPLRAATIQAAIDEAKACGLAERLGADSLDIIVDGNKVETVGLGAEPYRT